MTEGRFTKLTLQHLIQLPGIRSAIHVTQPQHLRGRWLDLTRYLTAQDSRGAQKDRTLPTRTQGRMYKHLHQTAITDYTRCDMATKAKDKKQNQTQTKQDGQTEQPAVDGSDITSLDSDLTPVTSTAGGIDTHSLIILQELREMQKESREFSAEITHL